MRWSISITASTPPLIQSLFLIGFKTDLIVFSYGEVECHPKLCKWTLLAYVTQLALCHDIT